MKKRVTIKDIAKHLLLSVSTVSRALIDDKNIRRETKERVLEAAQELGYLPNPVATNLKYGRTNSVGVIVPEMVTPYAAKVIEGIQDILYPLGLRVMIANSNEDPKREFENLSLMEQFMVDGIIVSMCDYNSNREKYIKLQNSGIPIVFFDRIPYGFDATQVLIDNYRSAYFLVEHLIRSGRKRIAYMRGPSSIYNSIERERGYRDAMHKFGLEIDSTMIINGGVTFLDGAKAVEKLTHCNAIFAFTDTLAIGAMNHLRDMGIVVPNDIAVAGFSGTELSTIVTPQLTSVVAPLHNMGATAAQLILERIKDSNLKNETIYLQSELTPRASTQ